MSDRTVYNLDDLRNWPERTRDLDAPARLAVIGDPVEHSLSPPMHVPALREAGIESDYVRVHLTEEQVPEALQLFGEHDFIGCNVTIPHKHTCLEAMHEVTDVARRAGAVNTVYFERGQMIGHNTDAPGFERAIRESFSADLRDLRVMIFGAGGGAGKAAAVQCALEQSERLVLVNRTREKAETLAKELSDRYSDDRVAGPVDRLQVVPWEEAALAEQMDHVDLIVNGTSVGMKRSDSALLPGHLIQPHQMVLDMIYSPPRTPLLRDAEEAGARTANGLGMLLWQGALSFEFWFNRSAPVEVMRSGLEGAL